MSRTITIVTPENIQITYRVAGIAARFLALLIDLFIRIALLLFALGIYQLIRHIGGRSGLGLGEYAYAIYVIASFLIIFAYPIFFEMLWGGRTPGKRLLGLRVIRDGGYPINLVASALRNILLFIDFGIVPPTIVLFGLPGLLCLFFSPTYKRIGDYAAGTLVIVETGVTALGTERRAAQLTPGVAAFLPLVKNVDRLTAHEYRILRRFSGRRGELDLVAQAALGERLARPLMEKLEIEATIAYQLQFADLLEAIERRYAEEMGVL
ncbi:MAG TPA: RDD family protein [Chthonomonadaceae bacterium]|nr:RDD family protein [Chthonomonadaceae bacterium]